MGKTLWSVSGGDPKRSGLVACNTNGIAEVATTVVTGVAGKRIIPVWATICFSNGFDSTNPTFRLRSGGATKYLMAVCTVSQFSWSPFFVFGDLYRNSSAIGAGENLVAMNFGGSAVDPDVQVGYYLLDA